MNEPSPLLLEASWEVCNKVGGIHTVITTKLPHSLSQFGEHYLAVGPWVGGSSYFREEELPEEYRAAVSAAAAEGVTCHFGTWLVPEMPKVFLIDHASLAPRDNEIKAMLWERFGLESLGTDFYDVDVPLLWSYGVGRLAHHLSETLNTKVLLQAHEWLSTGAILASHGSENVRSVFTTHATVLGRALSSTNVELYENLESFKPADEARRLGVVTKHQLEALGATKASVFTTVSNLTAREATVFLGRTPEVLTENGIEPRSFPTFTELQTLRQNGRRLLTDVLHAQFGSLERINLSRTYHLVTMGRYEPRNKGYDVFLRALGNLNNNLRHTSHAETVIAWILVPGDAGAVRRDAAFSLAVRSQIAETLTQYNDKQQHDLYQSLWEEGEHCANITLLPEHGIAELKQLISRLPKPEAVPISPWHINHEDRDAVTNLAREYGLLNRAEDRVKVIFAPAYLDGFDGYFNRPLYELVAGCDLGVFPSKYEPWGYTPMESMLLGLPTITTDLAGFGVAMLEVIEAGNRGFTLLEREGMSDDAIAEALVSRFEALLETDSHSHSLERMDAYRAVLNFTWERLYERYETAYAKALA